MSAADRPEWATVCRWIDAGKPELPSYDEADAPTIAETVAVLDGLARAARNSDMAGYRVALHDAGRIGATDDQIRDAYHWGRRGLGVAEFDYLGHPAGEGEEAIR